jgi:hypothetical protein
MCLSEGVFSACAYYVGGKLIISDVVNRSQITKKRRLIYNKSKLKPCTVLMHNDPWCSSIDIKSV